MDAKVRFVIMVIVELEGKARVAQITLIVMSCLPVEKTQDNLKKLLVKCKASLMNTVMKIMIA